MHHVRFGIGSSNYFNTPYWAAEELGFFVEEDLDVEPVTFYGTPEEDARLRSQDVHLGLHAAEAIFASIDEGAPLAIVAGNLRRSPFTLIGAPQIAQVGQLRGAVIGVSDLDSGTSTLLRRYLAGFDLRYQVDYRMRAVGMIPVRWELLQSGEIQAGLQGAPLDYIALDQGYRDLGDVASGYDAFEFCSIAMNTEWGRVNRSIAERVLRAYSRAHRWYFEHRTESSEIAARHMSIDKIYAERAWDDYTSREIFPPDGDTSVDGLRAIWEINRSIRGRGRHERFDPARYVDRSYFLSAAASSAPAD